MKCKVRLSKISLVSLHALIFKNTHSPERLLLVVILIGFLLVQSTGFFGSMSLPNSHTDNGYPVSYALEIWFPRLLYPLAAIFLLVQAGRKLIQRDHFLNIPLAGGRSILIYFVTMGFFHNGFDAYFFNGTASWFLVCNESWYEDVALSPPCQ